MTLSFVPFVKLHHLTFEQDDACQIIARICRDPWTGWCSCPHYSQDVSPIKQLWDVLHMRASQQVPVLQNNRQLHVAQLDVGKTFPVTNLVMSMYRRCIVLRDANG